MRKIERISFQFWEFREKRHIKRVGKTKKSWYRIVSYQLTKTNYQFENIGMALSDIITDNIIRVHPLPPCQDFWGYFCYFFSPRPLLVGVCYRPPSDSSFLGKFRDVLGRIDLGVHLYILGDMNTCMKQDQSSLAQYRGILDWNEMKHTRFSL